MYLTLTRTSNKIDVFFITRFLKWQSRDKSHNAEQCLTLNFGSGVKAENLLMVASDLGHDITEHDIATNKCFLVFIGGKYLVILEDVIRKEESISQKFGIYPRVLFITNKESEALQLSVNTSIPMVKG